MPGRNGANNNGNWDQGSGLQGFWVLQALLEEGERKREGLNYPRTYEAAPGKLRHWALDTQEASPTHAFELSQVHDTHLRCIYLCL